MRILLANEARSGGGGVETYLASLVPQLEARGHTVAILYANAGAQTGPTRIMTADAWSIADDGLERAMAAVRDWGPDLCFSHNMRLLDVDERLCAAWPTFKMMHGYFGACLSGHKAFSFPAIAPCPRVCGPGCLACYLPRHCGQLRPDVMTAQYFWARRQQRLFHRYTGIVLASDHMRREYLRYGIAPASLHTVPLFARPDDRAAAPAARGIDVLFLGRMTPLKGGDALVRAVHHAADVLVRPLRLVLAGDGPERGRLERLAASLGAGGRLVAEFPGWVDASARAALLSRAALVAIPSIWPEPFGLVGLEAAQFGVPAVAFDVGGIREWLTHDVNGRVADLSRGAPALGDAIAAVLGDPALMARLSSGAREAARRLSADAHVTILERVFLGARAA